MKIPGLVTYNAMETPDCRHPFNQYVLIAMAEIGVNKGGLGLPEKRKLSSYFCCTQRIGLQIGKLAF